MAKKLIETIYGKYYKYEVYRDSGGFSTSFTIYKDGKYWKSGSTLKDAIKVAEAAG